MNNEIDKFCELYFDNYNIYNLIRRVDDGYKLCFNKKDKLFMIINSAKNNQICVKFDKISPEIVKNLQKSRVENSRKIFAEIEEFNLSLAKEQQDKCKQKLLDITKEFRSVESRVTHITGEGKNKIKEGRYA